jgi:antitoxin component YwqK of YwqJK toxin-antitoxin module
MKSNFLKIMSISILISIIGCNNPSKSDEFKRKKSIHFEVEKTTNGIVNRIYSAYNGNNWDDTIMDGECRYYHPNGQLAYIANWKDGEPNGNFKKFHNNGVLYYETEYLNDGIKDGEIIFYNRYGKISQKENIIGGQREGEVIQYFNSGGISEISLAKNHKIDHIIKELDGNGKEMPLGTLKNGSGTRIRYHSNGNIKSIDIFEDGKLKWRAISLDENGNIRNSGTLAKGSGDLYTYDEFGYIDTTHFDSMNRPFIYYNEEEL